MMNIALRKQPQSLTPIQGVIVLLVVLLSHVGLMAAPVDAVTHMLLPFGDTRGLKLTADMGSSADVTGLDAPATPRVAASDQAPPSQSASDCWIEAVELAREQFPDLVSDKAGLAGHCTGGMSAILCAHRAEERWPDLTFAVHAGAPEHGFGGTVEDWAERYGEVDSPVFMFNASEDPQVSAEWVGQGLDHLPVVTEVSWYEATGAAHVPLPHAWLQESAVVWFRWKLLGDQGACRYWKAMPRGDAWDMQAETNAAPCE